MSRKLGVLKSVIAAWTAGDIDGALAHMHDDIIWHYAAAVAPPARGKAKARKFLVSFKAQITAVRWRLFDHAESGDRLFVEGVDEYDATDGAVVRAPYAGVLDFEGDLIIGWRDYVDVGVMESQKVGTAPSAWVLALSDRPAI
jgi:limonene-1,2-epoxide hydrolase